jgi:hypothetical protein
MGTGGQPRKVDMYNGTCIVQVRHAKTKPPRKQTAKLCPGKKKIMRLGNAAGHGNAV